MSCPCLSGMRKAQDQHYNNLATRLHNPFFAPLKRSFLFFELWKFFAYCSDEVVVTSACATCRRVWGTRVKSIYLSWGLIHCGNSLW
jgi:hypothetical protein